MVSGVCPRCSASLSTTVSVCEAPITAALLGYDEELLSLEPLQARFTFDIDEEELSLTVDEEPNVVDVSR